MFLPTLLVQPLSIWAFSDAEVAGFLTCAEPSITALNLSCEPSCAWQVSVFLQRGWQVSKSWIFSLGSEQSIAQDTQYIYIHKYTLLNIQHKICYILCPNICITLCICPYLSFFAFLANAVFFLSTFSQAIDARVPVLVTCDVGIQSWNTKTHIYIYSK